MSLQVVSLQVANTIAHRTKSSWFEVAYGKSRNWEAHLGPGERGDFLPGLGEVVAWGLAGAHEGIDVSGALVTEFHGAPDIAVVMYTLIATDDCLDFGPLTGLHALPAASFESLVIRSLVADNVVTRVFDREMSVFQTRSERAVAMAEALVKHLVVDAATRRIRCISETNAPLFVTAEPTGHVSSFAVGKSTPRNSAMTLVTDWR